MENLMDNTEINKMKYLSLRISYVSHVDTNYDLRHQMQRK